MDPTDLNKRAQEKRARDLIRSESGESYRRQGRGAAGQLGTPWDVGDLLPDVEGMHVLHLGCAAGAATVELAALGALVTAVDHSDEALERARKRLTWWVGPEPLPPITYVHADPEELPLELRRGWFDVVFTGGDILDRIQDLDRWAHGIAGALKPDGLLLAYDSHPVTTCVDPLGQWRDDYFASHWRLGQLLEALIGADLRLARFVEFQTLYNWLERDSRVPWDFALVAVKEEV